MMRRFSVVAAGLALALFVSAPATVSLAEDKKPSKALDVLFLQPHLATIELGKEVQYSFERKVSDPKKLGEEFSDEIKVGVIEVDKESGKRVVTFELFTGERARKKQRMTDRTGNPILVVFLDRAVGNYKSLAGGNRPYLKDRFRISLRDDAKAEPAKFDYNGKQVDGYKISVQPYADDTNKLKMLGYEGSTFTISVSDQVPGHFLAFEADYKSSLEGSPTMTEKITFKGLGVAKALK